MRSFSTVTLQTGKIIPKSVSDPISAIPRYSEPTH